MASVPRPNNEQVTIYLQKWDALDNYTLQEKALDKLFHNLCPENITRLPYYNHTPLIADAFFVENLYSYNREAAVYGQVDPRDVLVLF